MNRQSQLPAFLLTRPAIQGDRFALALRKRFGDDIQIVESPLLAPRFLMPEIVQTPLHAVIFTSETGAHAFARLSAASGLTTNLTAWCVGQRTADAARSLGLNAISAGGDATDLVAAIIAFGQSGPLLYVRGRDTRGELAERLNSAGIETSSLVCYVQDTQPLTAAARKILGSQRPVVLPLFSPRSAELFAKEAEKMGVVAPLLVVAMSPAVAEVALQLRPAHLTVASRPNAGLMIEAVADVIAAGD